MLFRYIQKANCLCFQINFVLSPLKSHVTLFLESNPQSKAIKNFNKMLTSFSQFPLPFSCLFTRKKNQNKLVETCWNVLSKKEIISLQPPTWASLSSPYTEEKIFWNIFTKLLWEDEKLISVPRVFKTSSLWTPMILHATFNLRSEQSAWPVKGRNETGLLHSTVSPHVQAEKIITFSIKSNRCVLPHFDRWRKAWWPEFPGKRWEGEGWRTVKKWEKKNLWNKYFSKR